MYRPFRAASTISLPEGLMEEEPTGSLRVMLMLSLIVDRETGSVSPRSVGDESDPCLRVETGEAAMVLSARALPAAAASGCSRHDWRRVMKLSSHVVLTCGLCKAEDTCIPGTLVRETHRKSSPGAFDS